MSLLTTAGRAFLLGSPWTSATIKVALLRPTYTPSPADGAASAITAHEVSGVGYTGGYGGSGRKALAGKTLASVPSADEVRLDADDLTWAALDVGTVGYVALVAESGGSDATSTLVAVLSFPVTATSGADLPVVWPATGIFVL